MSDDEFSFEGGLFEEPEDFAPPPTPAHFAKYDRKHSPQDGTPSQITLRLVGNSPLWGHLLWNAGVWTADYLEKNAQELVHGKRVLELGAAAALPSLVSTINKASLVVCTDYPDPDLISNIEWNFDNLAKESKSTLKYQVKGYIWGNNVIPLAYQDYDDVRDINRNINEEDKFDLIILSDVVFNHTEHHKLLKTCREALKKNGKCLVVFSPHRAHLLDDDLQFFTTCEEYQMKAEKIDMVIWKPMFEEDDETAAIRSRVYSYFLIPQWTE